MFRASGATGGQNPQGVCRIRSAPDGADGCARSSAPTLPTESHQQRVDVGIDPYEPHKFGNVPNFIRQIFNGRLRNDTHGVPCAQETRFYGRPKGVRTTDRGTKIRKTERFVFPRVSAIFASCASFLHTFFWQDRNGTKQQTSEAFAVWRGRATEWTSFRACAEARDMEFVRTSRRSDSYSVAVKTTPPVHPERSTNAMLPAGLYCIRRICYSDTQKNAKSAAQGAAPLEAMNLPLDGAKFDAGRR